MKYTILVLWSCDNCGDNKYLHIDESLCDICLRKSLIEAINFRNSPKYKLSEQERKESNAKDEKRLKEIMERNKW